MSRDFSGEEGKIKRGGNKTNTNTNTNSGRRFDGIVIENLISRPDITYNKDVPSKKNNKKE